jgi:hypothetical protein
MRRNKSPAPPVPTAPRGAVLTAEGYALNKGNGNMNNEFLKRPFDNILIKDPVEYKNEIPYFGSELEGDQFNEDDINSWTKEGRFASRWRNKGTLNEYKNDTYMELCKKAGNYNLPILDIASGPGLGLIPDIYSYNKNIHFLATDGCPILVEKWNEYFIEMNQM